MGAPLKWCARQISAQCLDPQVPLRTRAPKREPADATIASWSVTPTGFAWCAQAAADAQQGGQVYQAVPEYPIAPPPAATGAARGGGISPFIWIAVGFAIAKGYEFVRYGPVPWSAWQSCCFSAYACRACPHDPPTWWRLHSHPCALRRLDLCLLTTSSPWRRR